MDIPYRKSKKGITIEVRVEPRASRLEIVGRMGNSLKVKLTAPPVDSAANKQLIELLSKELGVRKSSISIIKGQTSKNKVVEIEGVERLKHNVS